MANDAERLERLHRQASDHYLAGDFRKATEVWQEILAIDPDDLRAGEGVRLCELLISDGPSFEAAEPKAAAPASPDPPDPVDAADFDFSDPEPEIEAAAPAAPEPPPVPDAPAGRSPEEAAAAELAARATELFAEATVAYEQGDRDEALALLRRLEILDENHGGGAELKARIAAEQDVAAEPEASAEAPDLLGEIDLGAVDDALDGTPPATTATTDTTATTPLPTDDAIPLDLDPPLATPADAASGGTAGGLDDLDEIDGLDAPPPVAAPPAPRLEDSVPDADPGPDPELAGALAGGPSAGGTTARTARRRARESRRAPRFALLVAGLLVVVVGGGWFAYGALFGEADAPEPVAAAEPAPTPVERSTTESPDAPVAEPEPAIDLEALRAEADAAIANEDYAAAIVALNKVLERRPDDRELKRELLALGERYREKQELLESWQQAIRAFDTGDYRTALTAFYRMPESEQGTRLNRYLTNGWYNLGMQALTAGNCRDAAEHFNEARQIGGEDPGIENGLALADECTDVSRDRAWFDRLEAIGYRNLEYGS